jgi:hypothetical protein
MKLTEIANRLREVAASIESFITNAFVDLRLVETFVSGRKEPPL